MSDELKPLGVVTGYPQLYLLAVFVRQLMTPQIIKVSTVRCFKVDGYFDKTALLNSTVTFAFSVF